MTCNPCRDVENKILTISGASIILYFLKLPYGSRNFFLVIMHRGVISCEFAYRIKLNIARMKIAVRDVKLLL